MYLENRNPRDLWVEHADYRMLTCPSIQHRDPHFNRVGAHQLYTITPPLLSQLYRHFRPLLTTTQRRLFEPWIFQSVA